MSGYYKSFLKSSWHAKLGLAALAVTVATGGLLGPILGILVYGVCWIYFPDSEWFQNLVNSVKAQEENALAEQKVIEFQQRRDSLLSQLSQERQIKYKELSLQCSNIEERSGQADMLSRFDELMWTYLKILSLQQNLSLFLEEETVANTEASIATAEKELSQYEKMLEESKSAEDKESFSQLLDSRKSVLLVLGKRLENRRRASANYKLLLSEGERLEQQVHLLKAEALTSSGGGRIAELIDANVSNLTQTNEMLAQMKEYQEISECNIPIGKRAGYNSSVLDAVPLPSRPQRRKDLETN